MRCSPKSTLGLYASHPDGHLHLPRSLNNNHLTGHFLDFDGDISGLIELAEVLPQAKLQSLR